MKKSVMKFDDDKLQNQLKKIKTFKTKHVEAHLFFNPNATLCVVVTEPYT